jgi:hypothetical protein
LKPPQGVTALLARSLPRVLGWADPWLIGVLLAPLILLTLLIGERLGEPVADDYDYLHYTVVGESWSWFDGSGANLYWRPLARQAYYAVLAPWMLHRPLAVALVQMGCLCVAAALLYRSFRPALGSVGAFAVSTAPWMMESSRLLIVWPSCFQDLGALLFVSLALHEAVAKRLWTFLGAGLAALLCKEVAAIALLTIVACPVVHLANGRRRRTWVISVGLLTVAWSVLYLWVHARASLGLPGAPGTLSDWLRGIALVPWWSFKAIWSLPPAAGPFDVLVVLGLFLLMPWSRVSAVLRSHELRSWWRWGLLWSVPLTLTLVLLYPGWCPYRFPFVSLGILAATMAALKALHRHALPAFLLVRFALLVTSPGPVRDVAIEAPSRGASIDVPQLSRLQLFVAEVRDRIRSRYPSLPPGSAVVYENFPTMVGHAFGSRPALHVWYRDTTLRWLSIREWMANPRLTAATIVEYQAAENRAGVALVEPRAMRALLRATEALNSGKESESLLWLSRAESLQVDTTARVFRNSIAGKRAYALARLSFSQARYDEARAHLLAVLALYPGDVPSRRMLEHIEEIVGRTHAAP